MFDFWQFYKGLFGRTDYSDNYWGQFPMGKFQFKNETLNLLKDNLQAKDEHSLRQTLGVIFYDGADEEYTELLLTLLEEDWHMLEEDIVLILQMIKDPRSINKLYELIIHPPFEDDLRSMSRKCILALKEINTPESIGKIRLLQNSDDEIIQYCANEALKNIQKD